MSPWRTWRHMKETEARGEEVATKADLLELAKDFARLALGGWVLALAVVGVVIFLIWQDGTERDRQRDASFNLICSALQANSKDVSGFAGAVVRLVPPQPDLPPRARDVRDTAVRVRDSQSAFAKATCTSREDLARLITEPPPPANP